MAQRTPPKLPATHRLPMNTSTSSRKSQSATNAPNWRLHARKSRSQRRKPLFSISLQPRIQWPMRSPLRPPRPPPSAAVPHGARHRIVQRLHAEGDVLHDPVEEESRRGTNVAAAAALDMFAHLLQIDVIVHLRGVSRHIQT